MLQGMTAHYLVADDLPARPGDSAASCTRRRAASGCSSCRWRSGKGARVFGTVSTEEKAALAREAGADVVIRYTEQDFAAEVQTRHRRPRRRRRLRLGRPDDLRQGPRVPRAAGHDGPLRPVERRRCRPSRLRCCAKGSLFLTRPTLFHYIADRASLDGAPATCWARSLRAARGPHRRTFPLADAAEAHRALEGRRTTGKVLLIP